MESIFEKEQPSPDRRLKPKRFQNCFIPGARLSSSFVVIVCYLKASVCFANWKKAYERLKRLTSQ